ncbi:MAG: sigma-70 family RNA polymerase sigma factor [Phycisphaerae bacterium]|nr:sigma-70 family RNA polymerase sigma factor [Phycisphaerae bacterium]
MSEHASNLVVEQAPAADKGTIDFREADLIRQCQAGKSEAFAELVVRYQDRVYNIIFRMCNRQADADELTQETFLKAFEKLDQFQGGSRFYTWLFRIATNLTLSHRRRGRTVKFHPLAGTDDDCGQEMANAQTAEIAARRNPAPEAAAMRKETSSRVTEALNELEDDYRMVVILRDVDNMNYEQISEALGVPTGTVKSRLYRARRTLRDKLIDLVS